MRRAVLVLLPFALLLSCVRAPVPVEVPAPPPQSTFAERIRPILEARCVVCHACYNSPCQFNQQTFEGVDRGGTKALIYDGARLVAVPPTRMFQDAQTTAQWRSEFKFFPLVSHSGKPEDSVLHHFLTQRRADQRSGDFDMEKKNNCPDTVEATQAYFRERPEAGMPYGMPPLDDAQFKELEDWLAAGAPPPPAPAPPEPAIAAAAARWEAFFDTDDLRGQLVARYLYEHLFLAHLYFSPTSRDFYRLVRSRTPIGQPVDEIATVRPFDDPGVKRVHYRLVRLHETIVHKTHAPFELSDAKLARFQTLFLSGDWKLAALPSYDNDVARNPFVAFAAIPPRARYQFMLDDAYYLVRAFIHGPVCKGQIALNVIDEHFWVMFLSPDADLAVTDPDFLKLAAPDLRVPSEGGDTLEAVYGRFKVAQVSYLKKRAELAERSHDPGRALGDLWNGDGHNPNAILTVYRHFDSASVLRGALGATPKTAWVIDYPVFERIYYDLVAGFNVFGNIVHQTSTRRYMDDLRVESENAFLQFLPLAERPKQRAAWYRGPGVEAYMKLVNPFSEVDRETRVTFKDPANAKAELWAQVKTQLLAPRVLGSPLLPPPALQALADRTAPYVGLFPDLALVRVGDQVFSIARHKAHLNVAFMVLEDKFLVPAEDTLGIVRGTVGSYPNLFLVVPEGGLEAFAARLAAVRPDDDSWADFLRAYGVRRDGQDFWAQADWFNAQATRESPIEGGLLDLSRYLVPRN